MEEILVALQNGKGGVFAHGKDRRILVDEISIFISK
jgi:hypothetical protein